MIDVVKERKYRPDEVAAFYSVSVQTIYRHINSGKIRAVKFGGVWRIPEKEMKKPLYIEK